MLTQHRQPRPQCKPQLCKQFCRHRPENNHSGYRKRSDAKADCQHAIWHRWIKQGKNNHRRQKGYASHNSDDDSCNERGEWTIEYKPKGDMRDIPFIMLNTDDNCMGLVLQHTQVGPSPESEQKHGHDEQNWVHQQIDDGRRKRYIAIDTVEARVRTALDQSKW